MLARRDGDGRPATRVQERLATAAPSEPLAALALLSMLRGDLEVVRDRLVRSGRVSALDAEADTLAAAWEVVTRRPPPGRWERSDAIWNLARRVTRMRRACSLPAEPLPEDFDIVIDNRAEPEPDWPGRSPALLAAAVAAGVLTPREVVLIARTRIKGRTVREVALSLGRPYVATKKERQRAEAALRLFVGRYDAEAPHDRANGGCARCRRGRAHGPPLATRPRAPGGLPGPQWPGRPAPTGRTRSAPRAARPRAAASAPLKSPAS